MYRGILLAICVFFGMPYVYGGFEKISCYTSRNINFYDQTYNGDVENYPFNRWNSKQILDSFTKGLHQQYPNNVMAVYINKTKDHPTSAVEVEWGNLGISTCSGAIRHYKTGENYTGLVIRYYSDHPDWDDLKRIITYSVSRVDSIRMYQKVICLAYNQRTYRGYSATKTIDTICQTIDRALLEKVRMGLPIGKLGKESPGIQNVCNVLAQLKEFQKNDAKVFCSKCKSISGYFDCLRNVFYWAYINRIGEHKYFYIASSES